MRILRIAAMAAAVSVLLCASSGICRAQDELLKPDETFEFAQKDSVSLYMDSFPFCPNGSSMSEKKHLFVPAWG